MARFAYIAASLVFASYTAAAPVESQNKVVSIADAGRTQGTQESFATDRAPCVKQSCEIANLSGSTGQLPTIKPEGGDKNGYKVFPSHKTVTLSDKVNHCS
jgi:hypothetical protein